MSVAVHTLTIEQCNVLQCIAVIQVRRTREECNGAVFQVTRTREEKISTAFSQIIKELNNNSSYHIMSCHDMSFYVMSCHILFH